jgi:hydrogenase maturation protease
VNRELAMKVADAVLYEGYMLYPYRPSAIKNRQRWTFGILYPPAYGEVVSGTERCEMHSEFLLETNGDAKIQIQLRFLHLLARQVAKSLDGQMEGRFEPVSSLSVNNRLIESWDEGVERSVEFELTSLPQQHQFRFSGSSETEYLRDNSNRIAGQITRSQREIAGTISVSSEQIRDGVLKLNIDVTNTTPAFELNPADRNSALLRSLLSAHTILTANEGRFVSLLDPPEQLRHAVNTCKNVGNFPVLVGEEPERDMLLCSPIVLYDYPQIAPESTNSFYDATEMDEMLTLRVMTLTDEEKDEMRFADERVRDLLQRTEQSAREQLTRTHGTIRSLRPVSEKP